MTIQFGSRQIGKGKPVFIISEIGVNHEGDFDTCKKMGEESARAGADAIKLQTIDPHENYVEGTHSWRLFRTCELTKEETLEIYRITRELGMEPFTTSPDVHTMNWIDQEGEAPGHKISSGMMTNDIILRETCKTGKPVLISTGLATTEQMDHAMAIAKETGNPNIALFQCTSLYPVEFKDINLSSIKWMADRYGFPVGFSDHTKGIEAPIVATTLGATMIEKHTTLTPGRKVDVNGEMLDYDHHIGLNFDELAEMVEAVRKAQDMSFADVAKTIPEAEIMVGKPERFVSQNVQEMAKVMLRCLVTRKPVKAGEEFTKDNIALKRPHPDNRGLEPFEYYDIMGKIAVNDMNADEPIKEKDVS